MLIEKVLTYVHLLQLRIWPAVRQGCVFRIRSRAGSLATVLGNIVMSAVLHERIVNLVLSFYPFGERAILFISALSNFVGEPAASAIQQNPSNPHPARRRRVGRYGRPLVDSPIRGTLPPNALDVRTMPRRHYPPAPAAAIADARAPIAATSFRPPSAPSQLFSRRHNYTNPRRAIDHGRAMSVGSG